MSVPSRTKVVLGRPWNALILNVLLAGPLRFSEFGERAEGPGDKVLSGHPEVCCL